MKAAGMMDGGLPLAFGKPVDNKPLNFHSINEEECTLEQAQEVVEPLEDLAAASTTRYQNELTEAGMMDGGLPLAFGKPVDNEPLNLHPIEEKPESKQDVVPESTATHPTSGYPDFRNATTTTNALSKYWSQRYRLFSRFDEGIQIDAEGWFSVTPEVISEHLAHRLACDIALDPFVGCGGNVVQLALTCHYVIAIDIDPEKIKYARANACIYGVEDRIEFILGDAMTLLPKLHSTKLVDAVFLSPPWGGPTYLKSKTFSLADMPVDGIQLFHHATSVSPNVAYFLPRNVSTSELRALTTRPFEYENQMLNGKKKTVTIYYGNLVGEEAEYEEEATGVYDGGETHAQDLIATVVVE